METNILGFQISASSCFQSTVRSPTQNRMRRFNALLAVCRERYALEFGPTNRDPSPITVPKSNKNLTQKPIKEEATPTPIKVTQKRRRAVDHHDHDLDQERKSKNVIAEKRRRITCVVDDGEDWELSGERKSKKLSLVSTTPRKKPNNNTKIYGPNPPPDMPQELKDFVVSHGGGSYALIIQKKVWSSDLNTSQSRLSMPLNQMLNREKEEVRRLLKEGEKGMLVRFIFPNCMEEANMTLKKWYYDNCSSYVLINNWHHIANNSLKLKKDDAVQIWFFRDSSGNPCLALVNLGKPHT